MSESSLALRRIGDRPARHATDSDDPARSRVIDEICERRNLHFALSPGHPARRQIKNITTVEFRPIRPDVQAEGGTRRDDALNAKRRY